MRKLYYDSFIGLLEVKVHEVVRNNVYLKAQTDRFPHKAGELIHTSGFDHLVHKCGTNSDGSAIITQANIEGHLPCV